MIGLGWADLAALAGRWCRTRVWRVWCGAGALVARTSLALCLAVLAAGLEGAASAGSTWQSKVTPPTVAGGRDKRQAP